MNKLRYESVLLMHLALMMLVLPLQWLIASIIAAFIHEIGHYTAVIICGGKVQSLHLLRSGAVMNVGPMNSWQQVLCLLAGPLAGLGTLIFSEIIPKVAVCAVIQSTYNLLPIYPLDGGRILRGLLTIIRVDEKTVSKVETVIPWLFMCGIILLYLRYRSQTVLFLGMFLMLSIISQRKRPCKAMEDWL